MNKKITDKQAESMIRNTAKRFKLSDSEKGILKSEIMEAIQVSKPQTNNQAYTFKPRKLVMPLIPVLIAALIAVGGGTAALADSAKPGDALYTVDQWIEQIQERVTWADSAKAGLLARFSEERMAEYKALVEIDPTRLESRAREMWEQHKEEAANRAAESIERANLVREQLEARLENAETESQREVLQRVIDTLNEVEARRELHMEEVEKGEFPGVGDLQIRQRVREWTQENAEEMKQLRQEVIDEFGEDLLPTPSPNGNGEPGKGRGSIDPAIAYWPQDEIELDIPQELTDAQKEWAEQRASLAERLAQQLAAALAKIDPYERTNPIPEPEPLTQAV